MLLPEAAACPGPARHHQQQRPRRQPDLVAQRADLVLLTSLSFLPALLLSMTSFTRILIVLGLLRTAIGTQTSPPNQVLVGLSLFLTFFVMSPVFDKVHATPTNLSPRTRSAPNRPWSAASSPSSSSCSSRPAKPTWPCSPGSPRSKNDGPEDVSLRILLPSFVISELKTAFQIGFTIFIPFLIVDLVVASVLMSMGMMMVPPATISLPFKLMLFVLVDGWQLLIGALAQSFYL
jgi:flagellar biosynthetic protein FliP